MYKRTATATLFVYLSGADTWVLAAFCVSVCRIDPPVFMDSRGRKYVVTLGYYSVTLRV